jgi:hypothetical protein
MANEKQLTTVDGTAIERYQNREVVREMADRLMALHPSAEEVGTMGMRAAAQLAVLVDASPLPSTNEIHVWMDKGKISVALGINYYRRKAEEWGGVLWLIQPRQMRQQEREEYGIPEGHLAGIARAVKVEDMEKYLGMGLTPNDVWDMASRTGIGTASQGEYAKKGRPPVWTAFKRAEVDLYRQLFPVQMAQVASKGDEEARRMVGDNVILRPGNGFVEAVDHEPEPPADREPMDIDAANEALGLDGPPTPKVESVDGDFQEIDEDAVEEAAEVVGTDKARSQIADFRAHLESNPHPTIMTVTSILAVVELIDNDHHGLQIARKLNLGDIPNDEWELNTRLTTGGAIKLLDMIADRQLAKAEEE